VNRNISVISFHLFLLFLGFANPKQCALTSQSAADQGFLKGGWLTWQNDFGTIKDKIATIPFHNFKLKLPKRGVASHPIHPWQFGLPQGNPALAAYCFFCCLLLPIILKGLGLWKGSVEVTLQCLWEEVSVTLITAYSLCVAQQRSTWGEPWGNSCFFVILCKKPSSSI